MEENKAWIWQALERVNGLTVAPRKGVRMTAIYQLMHGYEWFSSFSYHTKFSLCPFCHCTHESPLIFISHSFYSVPIFPLHPWFSCHFHITYFFSIAGFAPTTMIFLPFTYHQFSSPKFILSSLPELRKECLTHRLGRTRGSEGRRLGWSGASGSRKKMIEENIAEIWQALERVNCFTIAPQKGMQRTAIYQPMHGYERFSSFLYHTHFFYAHFMQLVEVEEAMFDT